MDEKEKESKELIHKIEVEDVKEKKKVWESCCIRTNPHAIAYFGQVCISSLIIGFSFIMLIKADGNCEKSSPYIGLISFLMGKLLSSVVGSGN